jgi:uncharacterized iron-regulated protein
MPYLMTHKGKLFDVEDAFETLLDYNAIFIGEEHSSRISHDAELTILKGLAERDSSLVLALEMFERDVQESLNAYLKGEISENHFLEQARPWPNYLEDYRPLVEFAKTKSIPVIAANIPRKTASAVATANRIALDVLGEDRIYLPKLLHLDSKKYYKLFMATMEQIPPSEPMGRLNPKGLYKAQVLKDAVMAASIEPFLDHCILFCCGHFHSDYHLGIPYQLQKNHRQLKIAVIAMASAVEGLPMKDRSSVADFIWVEK